MDPSLYEQLNSVEDDLWWHRARREMLRDRLAAIQLPRDASALDAGCGTGGTLTLLQEFCGEVVGVDRAEAAIQYARIRAPKARVLQGDITQICDIVAGERFNVVTLLNVLYHQWIPSVDSMLQQTRRILKPGGTVLITEAAFPSLARRHDRLAMGARRFTLDSLRSSMQSAGLTWISGTYFNAVSLPWAWASARTKGAGAPSKGCGTKELRKPPRIINEILTMLLRAEYAFIKKFEALPCGVALFAMAKAD